jgi:uncharacterized membrane protein
MRKDLKYYRENAEEDYLTTPISVLRYIGLAERRINVLDVIVTVLLFVCSLSFLGGVFVGQKSKQQEIENRAKQINKECYNNQELEVIIFGETQE